jgi:phospholipid/cholesterol/gamma-HCH transport system permease protein
MKIPENPQSWQYEISESSEGGTALQIQGRMDSSAAASMIKELLPLLKDRVRTSLTVDLSKVTYFDDFGVLVLSELRKATINLKAPFRIANANDRAKDMLALLNFDTLDQHRIDFVSPRPPGILIRLGDAIFRHVTDLKYLVFFAGGVTTSLTYVLAHPKSLRRDDTFLCMQKTGVDALPIVGLISFLLGLIMAFMSAVQLQQFGANIYVASLVSLSMTRELGPIMTAIIVAGRSGSAFAAEIGTMKISEEVDALTTMGFEPIRFLVAPKIVASVIVVPLLTLFSDLFAIIGGLIVGVSMLDLTVNSYVHQTIKTLTLFDVFWGFLKSGVFAFLIAWIGCLRGFQVKGGAAAVGQATTSAVVSSIFLIILTDSIFSVILRYWG